LNPIGPATPNILPVPEATIWQVCTTYVVSTVEIWVRLGDENVSPIVLLSIKNNKEKLMCKEKSNIFLLKHNSVYKSDNDIKE